MRHSPAEKCSWFLKSAAYNIITRKNLSCYFYWIAVGKTQVYVWGSLCFNILWGFVMISPTRQTLGVHPHVVG